MEENASVLGEGGGGGGVGIQPKLHVIKSNNSGQPQRAIFKTSIKVSLNLGVCTDFF